MDHPMPSAIDHSEAIAPMRIVMIPSVSGGIGHISRTAALARELRRIEPSIEVEYLLDTDRLRPFNIDATRRMGFAPRFLPARNRDTRTSIVQACLDQADVVVDDCSRYLLPLRQAVPHVGWITLAMYPIGDELFMDWPFMAQMDAVVWPYPPLVGLPAELDAVADKIVQTGPFLTTGDVPDRSAARARLGLPSDAPVLVYAPRGFPFGRDFGHRVLAGVFGAAESLRQAGHPDLRLVLLAVSDPTDLRGVPGLPETLPDWVEVKGVVTPDESLLHTRAASAVVGEGTSTMHEGAALHTPLVLVPGPIPEATLLGEALGREGAAHVFTLQQTTPEALTRAFAAAIADTPERDARVARAHALVTGGGGVAAAARLVLAIAARRRKANRGSTSSGLSQGSSPARNGGMKTMQDLFLQTLQEVHYAEKAFAHAAPKIIDGAQHGVIRDILRQAEDHEDETAERLGQVFQAAGERPRGKACEATDGLIAACHGAIEASEPGPVRDAAITACLQGLKAYQASRYDSLLALTRQTEVGDAAGHLRTLRDAAQRHGATLTRLVEAELYQQAAQ